MQGRCNVCFPQEILTSLGEKESVAIFTQRLYSIAAVRPFSTTTPLFIDIESNVVTARPHCVISESMLVFCIQYRRAEQHNNVSPV